MKKITIRILLVAAIACILSITAFAALSGLGFFQSIFGESANSLQKSIHTPEIQVSNGERNLALEALVSDGYVTNLVVSLTGKRPDEKDLFHITSDLSFESVGWSILEDFSTASKSYYNLVLTRQEPFKKAEIQIELNKNIAPLNLSFQAENSLENCVVQIPEGTFSDLSYAIKELQISPMGFLAIAQEEEPSGGLPFFSVQLKLQDGTVEQMEVEFETSDKTVSGGGGVIFSDDPEDAPLVTSFHGRRNPAGEVITTGQFSRIIDPKTIESIIINGKSFSVHS